MNLPRFIISLAVAAALMPLPFAAEARTAADFFVSAPDEMLPLLPQNTRLDMLDYFSSGMSTFSPNATRGNARIVLNEPSKLQAVLSRDSNIQIALVATEKDTLLAVIETVLTPVADSSVAFYDKSWQPLNIAMPSATPLDFVPDSLRKEASGCEMPDVAFSTVDFEPESGLFVVNNTTAGYYAEQDRPKGLALMSTSIKYTLSGKRLRKVSGTTEK